MEFEKWTRVAGKLRRNGGRFFWVYECPHCGKKHWRRAGAYTLNPDDSLGLAMTPCKGKVNIKAVRTVLREQGK
jgi:hypothetical protein